jgi:beta propeller repeat protein
MVFDMAAGTTVNLTADIWYAINPAISGDLVVWEGRNLNTVGIYAQNLSTGEVRMVTADDGLRDQLPAVNGTSIVWEHLPTMFTTDVSSYNWATGVTRQISNTPAPTNERYPDVSEGVVVYERINWDTYDADICAYDLTSGTERALALPGVQTNANVSGQCVTFENIDPNGVYHIKLWYLPTNQVFDITSGLSGQYLSDIEMTDATHGRIVYTDDRDGQLDIYMTAFSLDTVAGPYSVTIPPSNVRLDFASCTDHGTSTAVKTAPGHGKPDGFKIVGDSYWDISTSAGYTGEVLVTIPYDPAGVGGRPENLKLYHWKDNGWENATVSVDTVAHTITGRVSSFSDFVVVEPEAAPPVVSTPASSEWSLALLGLAGACVLFLRVPSTRRP